MPDANVSSCVLGILGSFTNSLGLHKKLREKRLQKRRFRKDKKAEHEELQLSRSLRQGPEDIQREYHKSYLTAGDQFEIGDGRILAKVLTAVTLANPKCSNRTHFANRDSA